MKSDPVPPKVIEHRVRGKKACIAFLHGFTGSNAETWGKFPELLLKAPEFNDWDVVSLGYESKFAPDLAGIWSADAPIDKLATLFRTTLGFGLPAYKTFALLAHSMGGLVVQRALVDDSELAKKTSYVFLFGTPSGGLKKASPFSFFKPQVRDMGPDSEFLKDLRSRWTATFDAARPFTFWTIAGERDEFVPAASSLGVFPRTMQAVIPGDHLAIVKPEDEKHLGFQLVNKTLLNKAAPAGPWNSASVAVESREFQAAIDLLKGKETQLDEIGLVRLALAYDGVGRSEDAIKVLESNTNKNRTDVMGTLAGRLKRRWMVEHFQHDYDRALQLYSDALALATNLPDQLYYHAINIAFLKLAIGDASAAEEMAQRAFDYAERGNLTQWRMATRGEASMMLGNTDAAMDYYAKAIEASERVWEIESMYKQAMWIAELRRDDELASKLEGVFRPKMAAGQAA